MKLIAILYELLQKLDDLAPYNLVSAKKLKVMNALRKQFLEYPSSLEK